MAKVNELAMVVVQKYDSPGKCLTSRKILKVDEDIYLSWHGY